MLPSLTVSSLIEAASHFQVAATLLADPTCVAILAGGPDNLLSVVAAGGTGEHFWVPLVVPAILSGITRRKKLMR